MRNIWITSDTHFGHENIIRYAERPFTSVEEMDEALIAKWNAVVKIQDHVYHLGDVAMSEQGFLRVVPRLNGHLRLVLGNHDHLVPMTTIARHFKKILVWRLFKPLILTHVPIHRESFGKASVNVHGHTHQRSYAGPYLNACVEVNGYTPIHLDEWIRRAKDRS